MLIPYLVISICINALFMFWWSSNSFTNSLIKAMFLLLTITGIYVLGTTINVLPT